jgi:hypothetical protein
MSRERRFDLIAVSACLLLSLAVRLPGLAVFLTADEARSWYGRSIIFLDSLLQGNLANTAPGGTSLLIENVSLSPAPGVTTMWAGTLGIIIEFVRQGADGSGNLAQFLVNIPFDPLDPAMLFSLRLPIVLAVVAAVGLTYWWSRPMLGRWGALLAAGLLALDPFYLALSRVLGHDVLVTTFMWLSLLAFLRAMVDLQIFPVYNSDLRIPHLTFILFSGGFAGLAFLSKYPALFIGAFIAGAMLIIYWRQFPTIRQAFFQWLIHMACWSVAAALVFILLWPAMWVDPLDTVTTIINDAVRASGASHQKGSFFLGQPVPDPGLLFYPLIIWLRSSPVVLVGLLFSLGQLFQLGRRQNNPDSIPRFLPLSLWAYVIFYMVLVTYGGKKQDRYILPAFPAMIMLAAMGYSYIVAFIPRLSNSKWILPVALLLLQLTLVYPSAPYYFSFFNPLAGGAKTAADLVQVGWGEGLDQAAAYLNTLPDVESLQVTSWYSTTFEPYFKGQAIYKIEDEKISRSAKPGLAADYVVFYINQVQRRLPSDGVLAYFQQSKPVHTVTLNGLDYAWIYQAPGVSHIIGEDTRLVGQGELLGFEWTDKEGRVIESIPSNSVAQLHLYWEWQGKTTANPIQVSLIDANGITWGWGYPQTETTVNEHSRLDGQIVIDDYDVAVFPGTPPGQYYLQFWIEKADTGEVIGRFPLSGADSLVTVGRPLAQPDDFDMTSRLGISFGPLKLRGHNFAKEVWLPAETRNLELFWSLPDSLMANDAAMTLALAGESTVPVYWEQLVTPSYPTTQWQVGDQFRQVWPLTLPLYVPNGDYVLQLTVDGMEQEIGQIKIGGRDRLFDQPDVPNPLKAIVGTSIELLGYQLPSQLQAGSQFPVTLYWQAQDTLPQNYTVFVQLIDATNQVVAQHDSEPQGGTAPTDTWATGEYVIDEHVLNVPETLSGEYRLIAGMYSPGTGERLPIYAQNGELDAIPLAVFEAN